MAKKRLSAKRAQTVDDFDVFDDVVGDLGDGRKIGGNVVAIEDKRLRIAEYFGGPEHLVDPTSVEHL